MGRSTRGSDGRTGLIRIQVSFLIFVRDEVVTMLGQGLSKT